MPECRVCGYEGFFDGDMCDECKEIQETEQYNTILNEVIHNRITADRGRELLKMLADKLRAERKQSNST